MSETIELDGRRLRSERKKKAILNACEILMQEGNLVPTAQIISDKAEVPIRSFFRHFPDMESLFFAMDAMFKRRYEIIFRDRECKGTFSDRLAITVKLYSELYEETKPVFRSTKAQLWRYTALQENFAQLQTRMHNDLHYRLPEFAELDTDAQQAIDALASFEMWERFTDHQGLSVTKSRQLVQELIESIARKGL